MATYEDKIKKIMAEMAAMKGASGADTATASNQAEHQTAFDMLVINGMFAQPVSDSAHKRNHHYSG